MRMGFNSVTFPKISKVYSSLLDAELMTVQTLATPFSTLFYLDNMLVPNRVLYFERDEFYAYDKEMRIYLEKDYPKFR